MIEKMTEKREISPLDIPESIRKKCPEAQKDYELALLEQKKELFRKKIPVILAVCILLIFIVAVLFCLL